MIEFVALPMLISLTAAALPYLLLRNRIRSSREVQWPSNRLLQDVIRHQAKKLNWLQWILLALRTFALIGIALAVANPLLRITGSNQSPANQPVSMHIMVIDVSPSMSLQDSEMGDQTLLSRAIESCRTQFLKVPTYDLVALIAADRRSELMFLADAGDSKGFMRGLDRLKPGTTSVDLGQLNGKIRLVIDEARRRSGRLNGIDVTIYSDLSQNDWSSARIRQLEQSLTREREELAMRVQFEQPAIGKDPSSDAINIANLTLSSAELIESKGNRQRCEILASVTNTGTIPVSGVPVQFWINDQIKGETMLPTLSPQAIHTVAFECERREREFQKAECRLAPDQLAIDNTRFVVIPPAMLKNAVVIAKRPDDSLGLMAAGRALGLNISYTSKLGTISTDQPIAYHWVDPSADELESQPSIDRLLQQGHQITLWLGPSLNPTAIDQRELEQFLPSENLAVQQWAAEGLAAVQESDASSALDSNDITVPIEHYWTVAAHNADWSPVLKLDNGATLAFVKRRYKGTLCCVMTAPLLVEESAGSAAWNAMAKWPSFVAIVDLLQKQMSGFDRHHFLAGTPFSIAPSLQRLSIQRPDGRTLPLFASEGKRNPISYQDTDELGHYLVSTDSEDLGETSDRIYAVNLDPNEMVFTSANVPESIASGSDYFKQVDEVKPTSLFRWLLAFAIVFLVAESILVAVAFSRRSKSNVDGASR